jgi:DNA-binding LytR/AlgR family response regulator
MNITCAIIDDEPLAVSLLEKYVLKTPFLTLQGKYTSAIVALPDLKANPVDLLFLDIQMPDLNGMEFSRMVSENTRIIFTTAFDEYALESYKVNALDYLLKPIDYVDFLQSAQKALQWYEMFQNSQTVKLSPADASGSDKSETESETIFIRTERKLVQIDLNQILYVEGLRNYVKIFIEGQTQPILSLMSMKAMEELLPPAKFIRVHRSFIVQPQKIKVIERNRIVFGKEYIPISASYKERFNEFLGRYSVFVE